MRIMELHCKKLELDALWAAAIMASRASGAMDCVLKARIDRWFSRRSIVGVTPRVLMMVCPEDRGVGLVNRIARRLTGSISQPSQLTNATQRMLCGLIAITY